MEYQRKYDLRSKKNQDNSRKNNSDSVVKKTPENILKRRADNNNTMDKKADLNKNKTSQSITGTSCPNTYASGPKKTLLPNP